MNEPKKFLGFKLSHLAIAFCLLFVANTAITGLPPTTLQGLWDTVKTTTFNFFAPNYQITTVNGGRLIETGNKNILKNGDFENSASAIANFTCSTVTPAVETTSVISGKQSIIMSPSAQTFECYQDATLYASNFQGSTQLLAMVWIRTNQSGIKVCSRNDGVTSTTNCVTVAPQSPSVWQLIKVPFISSSTSNGISIAASTSITGNVYIDDAFVGAVDISANVDQSRIAGESYWAGTTSATCTRTSATIGALTCNAALPSPTIVTSSMGTWGTTDNDLLRQTITDLPAGKYKAKFQVPTISAAASNSAMAINDGTTTCEAVRANDGSAANLNQTVECTFTYASSGTRTFELYVASAASTITVSNNSIAPRVSTKFILEYFGSGQIYSASCGANCVSDFSATISSAGVVSGENADWINGNAAVSGTSIYDITLAAGVFTVAPNCTATPQSGSALTIRESAVASSAALQYTTFATSTTTATASAWKLHCQKTGADFIASRTITGSFAEVATSKGIPKPAIVSAEVSSAGVVSQDESDFINGNCAVTDTSLYTCTWSTSFWLAAPKCFPNTTSTNNALKTDKEAIPTTSSGVFRGANSTSGAKTATGFSLICHGSIP